MSRQHRQLHRKRWEAVRLEALDRDGWRCLECGKAGILEVHHRVPLDRGGDPYNLENLATLCRGCHFDAHRITDEARERWQALITRFSEGGSTG